MRVWLGFADGQSIPEGYDKYIWISERCIEGIEFCESKNIDYEVVPKVFNSAEDIYNAKEYLGSVADSIISWLTPILNVYSNVSYEAKSWSYTLARDLDLVLNVMYEKYLKIKLFSNMGILADCFLDDKDLLVAFRDNGSISRQSADDEFHIYAYTVLISAMSGNNNLFPVYKGGCLKDEKIPQVSIIKKCKKWLYAILSNVLRVIGKRDEKIIMMDTYLPPKIVYHIMLKHPGKVMNYLYNESSAYGEYTESDLDICWRTRDENLPSDVDEFTRIMMKLIKKFLPMAVVENFNSIEKKSKKIYRHAEHPNAIFYSCSAFYRNEYFKNYLMRMRRNKGIFFCDIQHGGRYGIVNDAGLFEWKNCDRFYTWGWEVADYSFCKLIPMPVPKMICVKNSHKEEDMQDILFVDYEYSKNLWDISCDMIEFDEKRIEEMLFFENLDLKLAEKIWIRKFPSKSDISIWDEVKMINQNLKFDEEENFYKSLQRSRLVILASFETTVYEALYLNIPFIIMGNRKMNTMRCVKQDLEMLEKIGVLIYSYADLGRKIEEIYPKLQIWWNDIERQKVILYMQRKYARRTEKPEEDWEREICNFLK